MEVKLAFPQDSPPLSIISAAKIAGVSLTIDPTLASGSVPTLHFSSG
jgi:glutamyl-tRNA synthetase